MRHIKIFEQYNSSLIELRRCVINDDKVKNIVDQYNKISENIISILREYGIKIVIFGGLLTDNKELGHYKGKVPRNWPKDMSWDYVDGMYEPELRKIFIGVNSLSDHIDSDYYVSRKGTIYYKEYRDVFLHELGHAFDDAIGKSVFGYSISQHPDIMDIIKSEPFDDKPDQKIKGYYNLHPREYVANSFEFFYRDKQSRLFLKKNHNKIYNIFIDINKNL